ncbi:MAG: DUF420 domain-containing protein [Acidobacteria bacterium]|nr:DUF420 domain-containing protein [Acidobacteriota bacterium]MYJ05893.1 DUF420 domain-containing protein [Acidobacteriota bacterium]
MLDVTWLPHLNATLNATSGILLSAGYLSIRAGHVGRHRACMLGAVSVSIIFLVSYVIYHLEVGSVPFTREGPIRLVYFTVLITHAVLAVVIVPLVTLAVMHALRERFDRHVAIARWTLPIWIYVSISGVVVYWMLYQM